ncbi:MAG: hypothetical protein HY606_05910 [Planctomycetes bacterium]|nr:hypothetical protein [Planctomycetota bacterium]
MNPITKVAAAVLLLTIAFITKEGPHLTKTHFIDEISKKQITNGKNHAIQPETQADINYPAYTTQGTALKKNKVITVNIDSNGHVFLGLAATLCQDDQLPILTKAHPKLAQKIFDLAYGDGEVSIFGKTYKALKLASIRLNVEGTDPEDPSFPSNDPQLEFVVEAVNKGVTKFWCSHHYGIALQGGGPAGGFGGIDKYKVYSEMVALFVKKYKKEIKRLTGREIEISSALANEPDLHMNEITTNPSQIFDLTLYLKQLLEQYGISDPVLFPEVGSNGECFKFLDAVKTKPGLDKIAGISTHFWIKPSGTLEQELSYAKMIKELKDIYMPSNTIIRGTEYGSMAEDNSTGQGSSPSDTALEDIAHDGMKVFFRIAAHLKRGFSDFTYFADIGFDRFPNPAVSLVWKDKYQEGNLVQLNDFILNNTDLADDYEGVHVPGRAGVWAVFNQQVSSGSIVIDSSLTSAGMTFSGAPVTDENIEHIFFRDETETKIVGIIGNDSGATKPLKLQLTGSGKFKPSVRAKIVTLTDSKYFEKSYIDKSSSDYYEIDLLPNSINVITIQYKITS